MSMTQQVDGWGSYCEESSDSDDIDEDGEGDACGERTIGR